MVLDALIAFFALLTGLIIQLITLVADIVLNLVVGLLSLFGRKVERVSFSERRKARQDEKKELEDRSREKKEPCPAWVVPTGIALLALVFLVPLAINFISHRTVEVVATDGQALPFAKFVWEKGTHTGEIETNVTGDLKLPKKATRLSIRDRRYKDQTWEVEEIANRLTVQRSLFGKSLDFLLE